jgi:hypothetical protein
MNGWIINLLDAAQCRREVRYQKAIFFFEDGDPCFEVWFWDGELHRWFVMSHTSDPAMVAQGVLYFSPDEDAASFRARVASQAS